MMIFVSPLFGGFDRTIRAHDENGTGEMVFALVDRLVHRTHRGEEGAVKSNVINRLFLQIEIPFASDRLVKRAAVPEIFRIMREIQLHQKIHLNGIGHR